MEKKTIEATPKAEKPAKHADPIPEAVEEASAVVEGGFDEFLSRAQKAYTAYIDAQKEMWVAYRATERRAEDEYVRAEKSAGALRDGLLEQALSQREKAERESEEAYARAKELSKNDYEGSVKQALSTYTKNIEQAWALRAQALEQAWKIFIK